MSEKEKDLALDEELEELDDIVELTDESGKVMKFFHVGGTQFDEKWYSFFMPAEEIDGLGDEEVVVFEASEDEDGKPALLPVEDNALLEAVFEQFCREMEEDASALEAEELEHGHCCCGEDDCDCDEDCDCDCDYDCDCDEVIYEAECSCGNIVEFDEDTLEAGSIVCDKCGETLEFTFEDEE